MLRSFALRHWTYGLPLLYFEYISSRRCRAGAIFSSLFCQAVKPSRQRAVLADDGYRIHCVLSRGCEKYMSSGRRRIIFSFASMILLLGGVILASSSLAKSGGHATINLKVTGLRSEKGQVKIALFNSPEKWLSEHPIYSSTIKVDGQSVTWKINDVPYGDYGVVVFHDENGNGKMDKNLLGIPQEPYGFSNNVRLTLGPPKWEKAKFSVNGSTTELSIEVR